MGEEIFKKKLLWGYECSQVDDYIKTLQEDLQIAKKAFEEKLEEYALNLSMLTLQRDQMEHEIEELKGKLGECLVSNEDLKSSEKEIVVDAETGLEVKEVIKENESLKALVDEAVDENKKLSLENDKVKSENSGLKKTVAMLKAEARSAALNADMKISDFKQKTQINIDKISESINATAKVLEEIKSAQEKLP